MGIEIDRDEFEEAEYPRFAERLEACLTALRALLRRPGFGVGEPTVGAELELFLVDRRGLPLAKNAAVLQESGDPRVTLEVDRFNLELNPDPSTLAGQPFSSLGAQMAKTVAAVERAAGAHGGQVAMVGILPTLRAADLHRGAITDSPRYRALDKGLRRLRREPIRVRIQGPDPEPVELVRDDVAMEGANTSFQVHLRVDPDRFGTAWNAAAMATAPVLAVAGNSPIFLGRRLWEETRVALFEQAADDRDERGRDRLVPRVAFGTRWVSDACELFEDAVRLHQPLLPLLSEEDPLRVVQDGGVPHLDELRLHQGTVWRWNRPVYDASAGGHLRLELRALPAGPTVTDMLANAAFLIGVTLAVTPRVPGWLAAFPFARAHANFYTAAHFGLEAELHWPAPDGQGLRPIPAAELVRRLLPEAGEALEAAGVDGGEAGRLLAVVQERLAAGQTGSVWQWRSLDALQPRIGRDRALHELLERYLELSASDRPVHTWPVAG
jgi:hypothetical protein